MQFNIFLQNLELKHHLEFDPRQTLILTECLKICSMSDCHVAARIPLPVYRHQTLIEKCTEKRLSQLYERN